MKIKIRTEIWNKGEEKLKNIIEKQAWLLFFFGGINITTMIWNKEWTRTIFNTLPTIIGIIMIKSKMKHDQEQRRKEYGIQNKMDTNNNNNNRNNNEHKLRNTSIPKRTKT